MAFTRKAAIGLLRRAHDQKRLGHAYLISGPAGSGKREVAAELASTVNGTDAGDVFSSKAREIFVAEPESKSRRILIEQIRELEHGLQMRASDGRRKVAIIAEADRLQPQAANAFLKTLEEPPRNSLLLLLSALPESLYIQRRAALVEVLLEFWSDVLRASSKVARRDLIAAKKETAALAERFTAPEVLRRIQRLEELRDHLGRNIQEALAFEAAFLQVFGS